MLFYFKLVNIFINLNSKYVYLIQYSWVLILKYCKRIRDLREDNDKTQTDIARILNTSQTMYARYERGANELPIRHLITLAEYYNVTTDYILGLTDEM